MSISGKILQSIASNKIDEVTIDQICKSYPSLEIYEAFKAEVWPGIKGSIETGQIESKVTAMQVLSKMLTRLILEIPQNEENDEF